MTKTVKTGFVSPGKSSSTARQFKKTT